MAKNPDRVWQAAQAAFRRGDLASAVKDLIFLTKIKPRMAEARYLLGLAQYRLGQRGTAQEALAAALALAPDDPRILVDLARLEAETGQAGPALAHYRKAQALAPDLPEASIELARLLLGQADFTAAETCLSDFLIRQPGNAEAAVILGLQKLARGDIAGGWPYYDARWATPRDSVGNQVDRSFGLPRLPPGLVPPGPVWLWSEQGLGDELLAATLLEEALATGLKVRFGCYRRNHALYRQAHPGLDLVDLATATPAALADCRFQLSLTDLIPRFRPDFEAFRLHRPWLKADPAARAALRARYQVAWPGRRLVGIAWRSVATQPRAKKSLPLPPLAMALQRADLQLPAIQLIDLQYGDTRAERAELLEKTGINLYRDPDIDPLGDMAPAAAQIAALDAVVTISNTAAHLAGGLGIPGLVLLPGDDGLLWYWFRDRADSPWYPSLRLLRQQAPGDWQPVLEAAGPALGGLFAGLPGQDLVSR